MLLQTHANRSVSKMTASCTTDPLPEFACVRCSSGVAKVHMVCTHPVASSQNSQCGDNCVASRAQLLIHASAVKQHRAHFKANGQLTASIVTACPHVVPLLDVPELVVDTHFLVPSSDLLMRAAPYLARSWHC